MLNIVFITLVAISGVVIWYLLIRPKLHAIAILDPIFDTEDAFWAALFLKIKGWRVEAAAYLGIVLLELPDLIDLLTGANLLFYMPAEWQRTAQIVLLLLALIRAFLTNRKAQQKLDDQTGEK